MLSTSFRSIVLNQYHDTSEVPDWTHNPPHHEVVIQGDTVCFSQGQWTVTCNTFGVTGEGQTLYEALHDYRRKFIARNRP